MSSPQHCLVRFGVTQWQLSVLASMSYLIAVLARKEFVALIIAQKSVDGGSVQLSPNVQPTRSSY